MKIPVIEPGNCIQCEVCSTVCPSVFHLNDLGFVEIIEMQQYPENEIDLAIQNCPKDCLSWSEHSSI
jgi:ferredoxin